MVKLQKQPKNVKSVAKADSPIKKKKVSAQAVTPIKNGKAKFLKQELKQAKLGEKSPTVPSNATKQKPQNKQQKKVKASNAVQNLELASKPNNQNAKQPKIQSDKLLKNAETDNKIKNQKQNRKQNEAAVQNKENSEKKLKAKIDTLMKKNSATVTQQKQNEKQKSFGSANISEAKQDQSLAPQKKETQPNPNAKQAKSMKNSATATQQKQNGKQKTVGPAVASVAIADQESASPKKVKKQKQKAKQAQQKQNGNQQSLFPAKISQEKADQEDIKQKSKPKLEKATTTVQQKQKQKKETLVGTTVAAQAPAAKQQNKTQNSKAKLNASAQKTVSAGLQKRHAPLSSTAPGESKRVKKSKDTVDSAQALKALMFLENSEKTSSCPSVGDRALNQGKKKNIVKGSAKISEPAKGKKKSKSVATAAPASIVGGKKSKQSKKQKAKATEVTTTTEEQDLKEKPLSKPKIKKVKPILSKLEQKKTNKRQFRKSQLGKKQKNQDKDAPTKNQIYESVPFDEEKFQVIVNPENIIKIGKALKQQVQTEVAAKKTSIFSDYRYLLNITCFMIPNCPKRIVRLKLKHSLVGKDDDVLFIVADLQRGAKVDYEPTIQHYEDLFRENKIEGVKIMPLNQLKKEFNNFEQIRKLANTYDYFLCDARLGRRIYAFCGKIFQKTRCTVHSVRMSEKNIKNEVDKALKRTSYRQLGNGNMISIPVGNDKFTAEQVAENVDTVISQLKELYPGGFGNIRNISLKIDILGTSSLPIYVSMGQPPDQTPYVIGIKEQRMIKLKNAANDILSKFNLTKDGQIVKLSQKEVEHKQKCKEVRAAVTAIEDAEEIAVPFKKSKKTETEEEKKVNVNKDVAKSDDDDDGNLDGVDEDDSDRDDEESDGEEDGLAVSGDSQWEDLNKNGEDDDEEDDSDVGNQGEDGDVVSGDEEDDDCDISGNTNDVVDNVDGEDEDVNDDDDDEDGSVDDEDGSDDNEKDGSDDNDEDATDDDEEDEDEGEEDSD